MLSVNFIVVQSLHMLGADILSVAELGVFAHLSDLHKPIN